MIKRTVEKAGQDVVKCLIRQMHATEKSNNDSIIQAAIQVNLNPSCSVFLIH